MYLIMVSDLVLFSCSFAILGVFNAIPMYIVTNIYYNYNLLNVIDTMTSWMPIMKYLFHRLWRICLKYYIDSVFRVNKIWIVYEFDNGWG